jgi:hypothetical protein
MGSLIDRVLMAYRPLYLRGLLMDGQYRLPAPPAPPARGKRASAGPATPTSTAPSGLLAGAAIAAAARHPT